LSHQIARFSSTSVTSSVCKLYSFPDRLSSDGGAVTVTLHRAGNGLRTVQAGITAVGVNAHSGVRGCPHLEPEEAPHSPARGQTVRLGHAAVALETASVPAEVSDSGLGIRIEASSLSPRVLVTGLRSPLRTHHISPEKGRVATSGSGVDAAVAEKDDWSPGCPAPGRDTGRSPAFRPPAPLI
jgi:hypothetical protein